MDQGGCCYASGSGPGALRRESRLGRLNDRIEGECGVALFQRAGLFEFTVVPCEPHLAAVLGDDKGIG